MEDALLKAIYFTIEHDHIEDPAPDSKQEIQVPGLRSLLSKINLEQMDVIQSDMMLKIFLDKCYSVRKKSAKAIMDRWIASNPNEHKLPLFTSFETVILVGM